MRSVADECCDALLVEGLRSDGHDMVYIKEVAAGADDRFVMKMAADDDRVLLTEDKDFGELAIRMRLPAYGILLLRMNPADSAAKLNRLRDILPTEETRLKGNLTVVDEQKIRRRPLSLDVED